MFFVPLMRLFLCPDFSIGAGFKLKFFGNEKDECSKAVWPGGIDFCFW